MAMVMFLQCLNTSILTVALPDIARDLGADVSDGSWLLLSFSLGTCALLLQFVKWANNGRVRLFFLYGVVLFILSSLDCVIAKDFWTLVFLRFIQGVGISLAASAAPIVVVHMLPENMKGRGLAAMAAGTGTAMVLGPSLGGIMAGFMDWNLIFLVNVPLGLFALATAFFVIPHEPDPSPSKEADLWGGIFWFMAVAGSIVFLDCMSGASWDILGASGAMAAFGLILTVLWLCHDVKRPMISAGLVGDRRFILIAVSAMVGSMVTEGAMYMLPYFMQISWGMGVMECATFFFGVSVASFVVSLFIGRYCDYHSTKLPVMMSFLSAVVFNVVFMLIDPGWSPLVLLMSMALVGVSFTVFEAAQSLRIIRNAAPKYRDEAATMIIVLTYIGASFGLIAYCLVLEIAVPEIAGTSIEQLTAALMNKGFNATALLGLVLSIVGMAIAAIVSGKEDI